MMDQRRLATAMEIRTQLQRLGALTQDRDRERIVAALNAFVRDGAGSTFTVLSGAAQVVLSTRRQSGIVLVKC
jgi:hypothetical protein